MGNFDRTRHAADSMRDDMRSRSQSIREDFADYLSTLAERGGVAREDAQRLARDGSAYLQEWGQLVREDITAELKTTMMNAAMALFAGFVAAIGFLLLNFGAIWALSDVGGNVGWWFLGFGVAWLVIAAVLGAVARARQKNANQETAQHLQEDLQVPREHAQSIYHEYEESRDESSRPH